MSNKINVQMKQFNGVDYDNIFPDTKNGMGGKIIITPGIEFVSIKATSPSGVVYNGEFIDGKWIIEVGEYGEYTIQGEGSEPESKSLIVDTCKVYELGLGIPKILNDATWEQIRQASDNGTASSIWAVGDAKQITINGIIGTVTYNNYQPWVYILGFNHNAELEGDNRIHFGCFRSEQNYSENNSIALDDSRYLYEFVETGNFSMRIVENNSGGWSSSAIRGTVLNSNISSPSLAKDKSFLKVLSEDLKIVLKQCIKYSDNTGGGSDTASYVTATEDWAWLLSEFEVFGIRKYANSAEQNYQKQYDYYKNGNSKVKYKQSHTDEKASWWLRSVYGTVSTYFCQVASDGNSTYTRANYSLGLSPAFCV